MTILLLSLLAVALLVFAGRGWLAPAFNRGQWRLGAGLLSLGAFSAAGLLGVRGGWDKALALAVVGAVLLFAARHRGAKAAAQIDVSLEEARSLLGVPADATADEIRAAHGRLIRVVHPDKGGTSGLAAQLNAARDRLLRE